VTAVYLLTVLAWSAPSNATEIRLPRKEGRARVRSAQLPAPALQLVQQQRPADRQEEPNTELTLTAREAHAWQYVGTWW